MKITLAQFNPTVGDIGGNIKALTAAFYEAHKEGSDLLVLPELYLCGYPPGTCWTVPGLFRILCRVWNESRTCPGNYPQPESCWGLLIPAGIPEKDYITRPCS